MQAMPVTAGTTATAGTAQVMTAKQFEAEFRAKIHPGQSREAVEHLLRDWSVSFSLVSRKDFSRNSVTDEIAPPRAATSALIGTTRTLAHSIMSDTVAQVVIYVDKQDKVLLARCRTLTAGP
jgi:hypothetical protein